MDEIYRYLGQSQRLWDLTISPTFSTSVPLTEIWVNRQCTESVTRHRQVPVAGEAFRNRLCDYQSDDDSYCVLRLVYVRLDAPDGVSVALPESESASASPLSSADVLSRVLDALQLRAAFDFFPSCFNGVSRVVASKLETSSAVRSLFSLSYHPKLAVIWGSNRKSLPRTVAVCFAYSDEMDTLRNLLERRWHLDGHPMLLPFLCALLLSCGVDTTHQRVKKAVRETEVRTGHHQFANRSEAPAVQELGALSAKMNGWTSKLAALVRKMRMIDTLCAFMLQQMKQASQTRDIDQHAILWNHMVVLQHRTEMQQIDTTYVQQRVQTQANANDSIFSIGIARDSKLISVSSQNDASSMKTIAIVTMLFLPGSFVASVFSMPVLDWSSHDAQGIVGTRFGIFWAITIALTTLTFVVYALWVLANKRWRVQETRNIVAPLMEFKNMEESRRLSMKREAIIP
ncbi:hypothetical protein CMQ_5913 [Grosmannia clavigera kw1407]|uniref:Uncharacterized protein n=1 Tax=Grosmannia clavigera (strain kw1407 / UAMH 11150) TaxID=655863 RepID=F0XIL3_GROCL|nr:uncharacterized protein CMQ_5913 [Grosmannia clavigera kw1407]EFX02552.1 hypothetical protein CMQ_5913 [Grosmannia clavigera kw1407]